jgi:TRAP-type C4-dicarboxylate transport system permease small subunit
LGPLLRLLGLALAVIVFAMMLITFVDVVGRQLPPALAKVLQFAAGLFGGELPAEVRSALQSRPLAASFELTRLALGTMVFVALPLVTAQDEHITIGLLNALFKGGAERIKGFAVTLFVALLCAIWARELWIQAVALADQNERLMFLGVRLAPYVYAMSALTAFTAVVALVQAGLKLAGRYHSGPRAEI